MTRRSALQNGRTLIELLISMTIGLIIAAIVAGIYLSSVQTARVANQSATIEDSGRTVMAMIGNSIKQAGYAEIVGTTVIGSEDPTPSYRSQTLFDNERHLIGCTNTTALTNLVLGGTLPQIADSTVAVACNSSAGGALGNPVSGNDVLMVRYQGDTIVASSQGRLNDCLGSPAADTAFAGTTPHTVTSRPIVQNMYFISNGALRCTGNGAGGATGQTEDLITNVEQFKVFYGYDDVRSTWSYGGAVGVQQPTIRSIRDATYLNGLTTTGFNAWDYVVAVYVCMVVRSDSTEGGLATQTTYKRCPITTAEVTQGSLPDQAVPAGDKGVLRRAYMQVFNVRARSSFDPVL